MQSADSVSMKNMASIETACVKISRNLTRCTVFLRSKNSQNTSRSVRVHRITMRRLKLIKLVPRAVSDHRVRMNRPLRRLTMDY